MAVYYYNGKQTNKRRKDGFVAAKSEKAAKEELEKLAIPKAKLVPLGSWGGIEYKLFKPEKIKRLPKKDIAYMFKQFSFLIRAGVTTYEAVEVLGVSANVKIARVAMMIKPLITDGMSLADALDSTKLFPKDIIEKVRAGESSNSMEDALANISQKLEEELELTSNIRAGLSYPLFSLAMVFAIAMALLIIIVPMIAEILNEFDATFPTITLFLIACSDAVRNYWWLFLIILAILTVTHLQLMKRVYKYRYFVHKHLYDIPIFGKIILKTNVLYLCSVLSELLNNGRNIAESVNMSKKTTNNVYMLDILEKVEKNIVKKGMDLYNAMHDFELWPGELMQMIMIGVRTGNIAEVLDSVYHEYRYQVRDELKAATDLIQPISLIVIGIVVAVFMVGMYAAIYCIYGQVA